MSKTLNKLYQDRAKIQAELKKAQLDFDRFKVAKEDMLQVIDQQIKNFYELKPEQAAGATYIATINGSSRTVDKNIAFLLDEIEAGKLDTYIKDHLKVSYVYNSGFNSGYTRSIQVNYGENYTTELGKIKFSEKFYNLKELDDDVIMDLIAYLKYMQKKIWVFSGNLDPKLNLVKILSTKKLHRIYATKNEENALLITYGLTQRRLSDWDLNHQIVKIISSESINDFSDIY